MKKILLSNTVSEKCELSLAKMGYDCIKLPLFDKLQPAVATHADMLLFFDGSAILTHADYYLQNKQLFDGLQTRIDTTDEQIFADYPNDVLFNAVLTKEGVLFSKETSTSKFIKKYAKSIINVKQGYTACSTCRVSEIGFITTDKGLYDAYTKNGIDALLVEKKCIYLPGYDCGFIGGASVVLEEGVCFFGNISEHTDYERISLFAEKHGKKVLSLSDEKLTDIGGAVVL